MSELDPHVQAARAEGPPRYRLRRLIPISLVAVAVGVIVLVVGTVWSAVEYNLQEAAGFNGDGPLSPFVVAAAIAGPALMILGTLALIAGLAARAAYRRRTTSAP